MNTDKKNGPGPMWTAEFPKPQPEVKRGPFGQIKGRRKKSREKRFSTAYCTNLHEPETTDRHG